MQALKRLFLFLLAETVTLASDPEPVIVDRGDINGAKFAVALPIHWNRQVLILAHGLRPESQPLLADLSPGDLAYKTFLDEGWIVATSSFRRNGIIIVDALADLDALRAHIAKKYGQPVRVLVEGESLGGLLAVMIAERDPREPRLYDGVVAISPALHLKETPSITGLTLQPKIPLLFLANYGELEAPKGYVSSPFASDVTVVEPLLFQLSRGGHVNINQRERLFALRALNTWIDNGRNALPKPSTDAEFFDATVAVEPRPSRVVRHADGRGFDTRVTRLSPVLRGTLIDAQAADFAAVQIKPSTWFRATIHNKSYRVFYGRDFSSVKKRAWVAFPHAEGFFVLAQNSADATATAKLAVGDTIHVEVLPGR